MYSQPLLVSVLGLAIFGHVQAKTITARAVEPTTTGQIGVNPVTEALGDPSSYVGWIGVDTDYLSLEGSTTKWIGVNTEMLTSEVVTTTIDDTTTTTTVPVQVEVVTATAAAEGIAAGDVTVLLSEELRAGLDDAVGAAAEACGVVPKARARRADLLSCMIDAGSRTAQGGGGPFDLVQAGGLDNFVLEVGQAAPEILRNAFQVLATQAERNRFAIFIGTFAAGAGYYAGTEAVKESPAKLKFPGGKLGSDSSTPTTTATTTTSTSSACDPSQTPNENSPTCEDDDCLGEDSICTTGPNEGCRCTEWTNDVAEDTYDTEFGDEQQDVLAQALADLPDSAPPSCFENTDGDGFDGNPIASPSGWCVCSSGTSNGIYSTMESTTSPCAYDTMPTQTITISQSPSPTGPVTSCQWTTDTRITISEYQAYCTCNDNRMHGAPVQTTTVQDGATITTCVPPDAPTTTEAATPTSYPDLDVPRCMGGEATFERDALEDIANKACDDNIDGNMVYKEGDTWTENFFSGYTWKDPDASTSVSGYKIYVDIGVDQRACAADQEFVIDFKAMCKDTCVDHIMKNYDDCTENKGGLNYVDCASWRVGTAQ